MILGVAHHLWQSTLFVLLVWTLTLVARRNPARVRYWLWLAASVKFLLPLGALLSLGRQLPWASVTVVQRELPLVLTTISEPFSHADMLAASSPVQTLPSTWQ